MSLLAGYTRRLVRGRERRTGLVFEFVVDRLDVGDSDALLCPHPVGGATQHRAETLELRHGVVRSAGVEARRHEVRTTFAQPTEVRKAEPEAQEERG